jgi:hypothetical protein
MQFALMLEAVRNFTQFLRNYMAQRRRSRPSLYLTLQRDPQIVHFYSPNN